MLFNALLTQTFGVVSYLRFGLVKFLSFFLTSLLKLLQSFDFGISFNCYLLLNLLNVALCWFIVHWNVCLKLLHLNDFLALTIPLRGIGCSTVQGFGD